LPIKQRICISAGFAPQSTTFALSTNLSVPYTYQEADKPEPPDIIYSEFDANASVMSTAVDAPAAEKELEVLSYL